MHTDFIKQVEEIVIRHLNQTALVGRVCKSSAKEIAKEINGLVNPPTKNKPEFEHA